ncbi:MAG: tetratricopeptide repeat protein [Elusimicrobia bacterium]|nr:tetratricopeptide repeat protein [Elusimicrobiota bacterium]
MADVSERRKHKRFAVIEGIAEPVEVHFPPPFYQEPVVGHIVDISSGGLGLTISEPLPKFFTFSLYIRLRGIEPFEIKGKVIRLENMDGQYLAGISFTEIDEATVEMLNLISDDFEKCRKKRAGGDKNFCFDECMFGTLCAQKGKSAKVHATDEKTSGIVITDVKQETVEELKEIKKEEITAVKSEKPVIPPPSVEIVKEVKTVPAPICIPEKQEALDKKSDEIIPTVTPEVAPEMPKPEISAIHMVETPVVQPVVTNIEKAVLIEEGIIAAAPALSVQIPPVSVSPKKMPAKIKRYNVLSVIILFFLIVVGAYIVKDKITEIILDIAEKKLLVPEYEAAVKNYKIVLKYEPKKLDVRLKLAQTYGKMRMYANAEREYKKVILLHPDNFTALLELGKINLKLNRLKDAKNYLIRAKFLTSRNTDISFAKVYLGICYEKEKKYDDAIKEFSDISADLKLTDEAYLSVGKVFGLKGNFKTAILFLSRANLSKNAVEYFETGIVKNETEPDDAVVNFLKALAKKNDFTEAFEWLGFLYRKKAIYDASLDAYREALNISPQSARVIFNIAQIHALKDDISSALAALDKAVSLDRTYRELAGNSYEFNEMKNLPEFKRILRKR